MKGWSLSVAAVMLLCVIASPSGGDPASQRREAMDKLWEAYGWLQLGDFHRSAQGVETALALDPDLAYAHVVRAEIAMRLLEWEVAQLHFERGLELLRQPDQPLSPVDSIEIPVDEVEADTRCFLGYVYYKLGQEASFGGDDETAAALFAKARQSIQEGSFESPSGAPRELADWVMGTPEMSASEAENGFPPLFEDDNRERGYDLRSNAHTRNATEVFKRIFEHVQTAPDEALLAELFGVPCYAACAFYAQVADVEGQRDFEKGIRAALWANAVHAGCPTTTPRVSRSRYSS